MEQTERSIFDDYKTDFGTMVYELIKFDTDEKEQFAFLIKEETKYINKHKYRPSIQLRIGLINVKGVWVMPIMMLFNNDYNMLYETYFNYYQTSGGIQYLKTWEQQNKLLFIFYNEENKRVRNVETNNMFQDEIKEIEWRLSNIKPWTMEEFDKAKEIIYQQYPNKLLLWNKLTQIKGIGE